MNKLKAQRAYDMYKSGLVEGLSDCLGITAICDRLSLTIVGGGARRSSVAAIKFMRDTWLEDSTLLERVLLIASEAWNGETAGLNQRILESLRVVLRRAAKAEFVVDDDRLVARLSKIDPDDISREVNSGKANRYGKGADLIIAEYNKSIRNPENRFPVKDEE